ncbi:hypothetical protein H4W33_004932 [Kibdelosporangium phytohabitans]|uniref:DUF3592 domain-containing protein n=1 Tax=Kibdelosporangium phytohabitans TaxID=860235 RepID=A0A0N9HNR8_9PSEU|nr:hypothetical protein AOZ06_02930 [Kibdelosporangium phytohabitans]MBE1465920.1 hypothetical protein [Kibdelosporangium phytohabitans]
MARSRRDGRVGGDRSRPRLVVSFQGPSGGTITARVRERNTGYRPTDKVRVHYPLNVSGDTSSAELTEWAFTSTLLVVVWSVLAVIGLGIFYRAWWRMPPTEPAIGRDELAFRSDYRTWLKPGIRSCHRIPGFAQLTKLTWWSASDPGRSGSGC